MLNRTLSWWPCARVLFGAVTVLAMLAHGTARAQYRGAGARPSTFRLWHKTAGYGQEDSHTAVGGRLSSSLFPGLLFSDGQLKMANSRDLGVNIGGGYRFFHRDPLHGSQRIFGVSGWYDGEETPLENYFSQSGFSIESLGDRVDFRLNGNFPTDGDQRTEAATDVELTYVGNQLVEGATRVFEIPLSVVDYEVAVRLLDLNLWAYGGGYNLDGTGVDTHGYKLGARGQATDDLILDLSVSDDDNFHTNVMFSVIWFPGRSTAAGNSCSMSHLARRMNEPVFRNNYVALDRETRSELQAVADDEGNPFLFVHVDSTAPGPGDGTFESPLADLTDVEANSQPGNIVLVHGGSTFNGQSVTLQDEQRLLGEGDDFDLRVANSTIGAIRIPETAPGASSLAKPEINNAPGDAIVLDLGSDPALTDPVEISNLTIDGGTRAIATTNGVGGLNANRLDISNTSGDAIVLTPLVETLPGGGDRVRFRPLIDQVNFDSVGGDDLVLNAAHAAPPTATIDEQITVSNTTSVNGGGIGISLSNNSATATISDYAYNGGTSGAGGIRIADSEGDVQISNSSVTGGTGPGIEFNNANALYPTANVTITDPGGTGLLVSGGTAAIFFNGRIEQGNNAAAAEVNSGHSGSVSFLESTTGAGVISATDGTGLQFNNADGTYAFDSNVSLNGGDAGVDIIGSDGTFLFSGETEITDPSGNAFVISGGTADIQFNGRIEQANNASGVVVNSGHDGTVFFVESTAGAGVVAASDGDGLQFDNADGAYFFNSAVELDGGDAGIDVVNDSEGSFTFAAGSTIANPAGDAFVVTGSNAVVTYQGTITDDTGRPVVIENNLGGVAIFTDTITGTDQGISIQNNTSIETRFTGLVDLNTGSNDGITVSGNTAGDTQFNDLAVQTSSGTGINVVNEERITLNNGLISSASSEAIRIDLNGTATLSNVTLNNVLAIAGAEEALLLTGNGAGAKTMNVLIQDGDFTNNDPAVAAVDIEANGEVAMNLTIVDNEVTNDDAATGRPLEITANDPNAAIRLDLNGNTGVRGSVGDAFFLEQVQGTFTVEDLANVDANNTGGVNQSGTITNDAGGIPTP